MSDYVEVSYTGDLLSHRRCRRAWAYEKHAGFHPYEVVQAMEGRLTHHAMEWLARRYRETGAHATNDDLKDQLARYFRILWAQGIRTSFATKQETLDRVLGNLFPGGQIDPIVRTVIEGALHTEYELRTVRKVLPADFGGKTKILLTGVLDVVVQEVSPPTYAFEWTWADEERLEGQVSRRSVPAGVGDLEVWDYKATRADSHYLQDFVLQILTYAALYREKSGRLPDRGVLFFINEPRPDRRLLSVPVTLPLLDAAVAWTHEQVKELRRTVAEFEASPHSVSGGDYRLRGNPVGQRLTDESTKQCTACGRRFDCPEYGAYLRAGHSLADVDPLNVNKN